MAALRVRPENDPMANETDKRLSVDTAITLVLNAERDALAQIDACEKQADDIIREARHTIRGMVRRTDERISRLHAGCARRNRDLIAELEGAAGAGQAPPGQDDGWEERLAAAVADAARRLTTLEPGGVD
jgi:hypothetical protein